MEILSCQNVIQDVFNLDNRQYKMFDIKASYPELHIYHIV